MKKLAILTLLILSGAGEVWAQGTRKDDIVINSRGFPQGGASVAICAQPAVTTTTPCSPLANLFSNPALTQALVNPLTTDGLGNYSFYAAPGKYTVQIYGAGITTKVIPDVVLPNDPSTPSFTTVTTTSGITAFSLTLSGNLTVSGSAAAATFTLSNQGIAPGTPSAGNVILYTKSADKKLYVKDETGTETQIGAGAGNLQFTSKQAGASADLQIQAAMNALPTTGGTVMVDLQGAQTVASDVFSAVTKSVHLVWTSGQSSFSANTTFPANISNEIRNGATWTAPTGVTILAKQQGIIAGNYKIFSTSGTGAINVGGKDCVNVKWWGAVGDNVTDDSAAILAAMNAILGLNSFQLGGCVYFPPTSPAGGIGGSYRIGTALTVPTFTGTPLTWYLGGSLKIDATVTGATGFSVIGTPGASMNLSGLGQFQNAPGAVITGTASPLFLFPGKGDIYMEKLHFNTNNAGQTNVQFDNCTSVKLVDVYNEMGATNTTGAPYVLNSGFKFQFKGGGAVTSGVPNTTATISTISRTGSTVTVTATANFSPQMRVGDFLGVSSVTDAVNFPASNVVVLSTPTAASFTYSQAGSAVSSSGGTVTYRVLAPGIRMQIGGGSGGINPPGLINIEDFYMSAGGIRYDTTGGSTSGGQIVIKNVLMDSDGNGNGQAFMTLVGSNVNLINNVIIDQVSVSDYGNGGVPFIVHAGASYTRGWDLRDIGLDNPSFSPYFGGNTSLFAGVSLDGAPGTSAPAMNGADANGFLGGGFVSDPSGNPTIGNIVARGHLHNRNTDRIYVEMAPPTGLTASLAAGGSLTVGTQYWWIVTAVDDAGNDTGLPLVSSLQSGVLTAGPLGAKTLTPTSGNQTASLAWTGSTGAVSYNVYRNTGTTFSATGAVKFNTTSTSFSDTGGAGTAATPLGYNAARVTGMDSSSLYAPMVKTANLDSIRVVDGVKFTTIQAALNDLPTTGGKVIVPPGYSETLAANLVLSTQTQANATLEFAGPATITMGSFQVTAGANVNGLTIQGPLRGSSNANHAPIVVFKYTGTGAAFVFGASTASTFDLHLERFGIDITGAGNAAQALQINRYQNVTVREMTLLGKQLAGTTQILLKSDGTGGFNAYQTIDQPYFLGGNICIDFAGPAAGNNQNQIIGGFISPNNTTDGKGIFVETGDTNNFLWPDVFSANVAVEFGANVTSSLALVRVETNTTDVKFDSGAGAGAGNGITVWTKTTPVVSDLSGNNNNIASQFPTGYLALFKNLRMPETSAPTLGAAGFADCFASSTAHAIQCSYNGGPYLSVPQVIASGTAALGTAAIAATNCATVVTVGATGVATTDSIAFSLNATATGYTSATGSGLNILAVPTAGNVNFYVCNPTAASITPAAATLNWRVLR